MSRVRPVFVVMGLLAGAMLFAAARDFWSAASGDTGDTSPSVPFVFGIVFAVFGCVIARQLVRLWREDRSAK